MNIYILSSSIIGWTYVILWDFSFYPTAYEIIKLKRFIFPNNTLIYSGEGVKLDYIILNITGYTALCIYSTTGYYNPDLGLGLVVLEDLIFTYHSLFMSLIAFILVLYFPVINLIISFSY